MKPTSKDIEQKLHDQQATELDEALLDRLVAAAEGTLTDVTEDEMRLEAELRGLQTQGLSPQFLKTLEKEVASIPAPTQVHVLPFPRKRQRQQPVTRKPPIWAAAAAAVALMGVLSSWWLDPMAVDTASSPGASTITADPAPANGVSTTAPAQFSRALTRTQDEGIIWGENKEPHRVLKVTYTDRVSMKREDGSTYQVEKPRIEYYLVPTESQ